jgi:surfactin synthase thioesterase subunit
LVKQLVVVEDEGCVSVNIETRISTKAHPWIFLGLTLGLAWAFEVLAVALQKLIPA